VTLNRLVAYCERLLGTAGIADWEGAVNGLQVQNSGRVRRLAGAVDANPAAIRMAIEAGADLLVVHHGLFWGPTHPWTGRRFETMRLLFEHDLAVYSSHLPLDVHRTLGNNALFARALGWRGVRPCFFEKGRHLGLRVRSRMTRDALARQLEQLLGRAPTVLACGPAVCRSIGLVTGGAGSYLRTAAADGLDTFITGEGPHWTFTLAEELGMNVFYCGHYATETFGVQALVRHLGRRFRLPWLFLDHPSGL
jgi:dinuclear metal center YbgI/SA1388 family protein